ncbi:abcG22 [Symbiodinium sp. CCMP2592]|nr:abcG22 [Symbiodinium sp. CCMP2592]
MSSAASEIQRSPGRRWPRHPWCAGIRETAFAFGLVAFLTSAGKGPEGSGDEKQVQHQKDPLHELGDLAEAVELLKRPSGLAGKQCNQWSTEPQKAAQSESRHQEAISIPQPASAIVRPAVKGGKWLDAEWCQVLDEPTSGLDSKAAEAIVELLTGIAVANNLAALCRSLRFRRLQP